MLWQMFVPENARFINEVFKMAEKIASICEILQFLSAVFFVLHPV